MVSRSAPEAGWPAPSPGSSTSAPAVGPHEHVPREHVVGRAERDLAAIQAQHTIPAARLLDVVRGDEHGASLVRERVEQVRQLPGRDDVKAREGLVEQQQPARPARARAAMSTRWRWPPLSLPNVSPARSTSPTSSRAARARSRSARPGRRHHGRMGSAPIRATSSALTGKSRRERSVCGTLAAWAATAHAAAAGRSSPSRTRNSVVLPARWAEQGDALARLGAEAHVDQDGHSVVAGGPGPRRRRASTFPPPGYGSRGRRR